MAFNPTPSAHIAGITVTSNNLVIPLTSIPELTQAEVVDATGDIRKVAYALTQKLHSVYQNISAEDKPTKWSVVAGLEPLAGVIPLGLATAPYLYSFHALRVNRLLWAEVAQRMTGRRPPELENRRKGWCTDTGRGTR